MMGRERDPVQRSESTLRLGRVSLGRHLGVEWAEKMAAMSLTAQ